MTDIPRGRGGDGSPQLDARLFGCVRWLVIVAAQTVLAVAGYVRPPSPGIESLPPVEAYDEL